MKNQPEQVQKLFIDLLKKKRKSNTDVKILLKLTYDMEYFQNVNSKKYNIENELHKKICQNLQFDYIKKG